MPNISAVTRYFLKNSGAWTFICFSIIIFNLGLSAVFAYFNNRQNGDSNIFVGNIDITPMIVIFILGLCFFKPNFKFMLANGVTRKRFFLAAFLNLAILAAVWALGVTFFAIISKAFVKSLVLYEQLYENWDTFHTVWLFAVFFMSGVLGWFINLLYYRSSKWMKVLISFAPFILLGLFLHTNQTSDGILARALAKFIAAAMGFATGIPNPYVGAFSLLLLAIILCACNFLLIRRAELKE